MALRYKELHKQFGLDAIVVHKPKDLDYFIFTSPFTPVRTAQILRQLADRVEKDQ